MVGIDTITLTLAPTDVIIGDTARFTPNAATVLNADARNMGKGKYISARCFPTKQEIAAYGYLPFVTLYKALRAGGLSAGLRVQFSATKLLYGNNFDELKTSDFTAVCERLLGRLDYYGIKVIGGVGTIQTARVGAVHYAKNFVFTDYTTPRDVIQELQKCDVSSWRDVSASDYFNNGYGYKTHSKYYEVAFYDKMAELRKDKRGQAVFDKDAQVQLGLFSNRPMIKPFEVLRMEVRLNSSKIIKQQLTKAKLEPSLFLKDVCTQGYSKAVLASHLQDLYTAYPRITEASVDDPLQLLSDLYVQNPERSMSTIVNAVGLYALNQQSGTRAMKDIVGSKGSQALLRLLKRTNRDLHYRSQKAEVFQVLEHELNDFKPVRLENYDSNNHDHNR
jgi:hypothetical protein